MLFTWLNFNPAFLTVFKSFYTQVLSMKMSPGHQNKHFD